MRHDWNFKEIIKILFLAGIQEQEIYTSKFDSLNHFFTLHCKDAAKSVFKDKKRNINIENRNVY